MSRNTVSPPKRRHDLDNLRTFLTILVIYHHTALGYGGPGSWLFKSRFWGRDSLLLAPFNAINQSFFMGLFFWLSGYMSGNSLAGKPSLKSRISFLRSKLFHLGLPATIYTLMIHPSTYLLQALESGSGFTASTIASTFGNYWRQLRSVRGPVWYLATLVTFDMVACCVPRATPEVIQRLKSSISSRSTIYSIWTVSTLVTFLIRIPFPVGTSVPIIAVQPAYLPQYILSYSFGHISSLVNEPNLVTPYTVEKGNHKIRYRPDSASSPKARDTATTFPHPAIPITLSLLSFPLILLPSLLTSPRTSSNRPSTLLSLIGGGLTIPAFLYTVWNEASFSFVGPSLIFHFARFHHEPTPKGSLWNPRYSYAAFLVHPPVSVISGILVDRILGRVVSNTGSRNRFWQILGPVVMTAVVGSANVVGSFAFGKFMIEHVPGIGKAL